MLMTTDKMLETRYQRTDLILMLLLLLGQMQPELINHLDQGGWLQYTAWRNFLYFSSFRF